MLQFLCTLVKVVPAGIAFQVTTRKYYFFRLVATDQHDKTDVDNRNRTCCDVLSVSYGGYFT